MQHHNGDNQRRVYTEAAAQYLEDDGDGDEQQQDQHLIAYNQNLSDDEMESIQYESGNKQLYQNKQLQNKHNSHNIHIDNLEFDDEINNSNNQQHLLDEIDLDEITPEEFTELMKNPKLAALFANANGVEFLNGQDDSIQQQYEFQLEEDGNGMGGNHGVHLDADGDEEDDEYEYIDLDNLPNDQQQYFLQDDQVDDSQNNSCQVQFLNQSYVQEEYDREHIIEGEDGEIIHQDADSDYCEDLIEVYHQNGDDDDVLRYKGIHLMVKGDEDDMLGQNESQMDKYQCPETGAHFEFLDMIRRLKKLQTRRKIIDKVIDEENRKQLALVQKQKTQQLNEKLQSSNLTAVNQSQLSSTKKNTSKYQGPDNVKQTSIQLNQSEFKENLSDLSSVQIKDSNKASIQFESVDQQQQQNTRNNIPMQLQAKIKQIKEAYVNKPMPTENNLMTEEGAYNSFHFYGTTDTNKQRFQGNRYIQEDTQIQEEDLIDYLNQKPAEKKQSKGSQLNKNLLKNLLVNPNEPKKQQICITEANVDSNTAKLSKKRQEEYNMFFNSNVETVPSVQKNAKVKVQQQQQQQNLFPTFQQHTFDGRTFKEQDLLNINQMLLTQQQQQQKANHNGTNSNGVNIQVAQQQPNVFKFKKSTEKLSNKRTPSANSKAGKKRNNSQNLGNSNTASLSYHNKTHSFNQLNGFSSSNFKQSQIQQMLMSFYQNQNNNPIANPNYSRTNYSKSIYENNNNQGNHTIRDSSRTNTQPIGPKILVSGVSQGTKNKNIGSINQIYSSIGSNSGKSTSTKAQQINQSKRQKQQVPKKNYTSGLQPRGNTLDNRQSSSQQQQSHQNNHTKQVLKHYNEMQLLNQQQQIKQKEVNSNSTTAGMNSQNVSRPASAVKKVNGQSPIHVMMNSKIANLNLGNNHEIKNILFSGKQKSHGEQVHMVTKGQTQKHITDNIKTHKKAQSISVNKLSQNLQKTKLKSAIQQNSSNNNNNLIAHNDYNSYQGLDQILYSNLETQPAEYNYSTFNDGLISSDQDRGIVYTMNSNKKQKNINPFIQNTASSQKSRQKSNSKISTSKSRQKSNNNLGQGGNELLFKPMQISEKIKQSAKLRNKQNYPQAMKLDMNSVMDKITLKMHNEASRAQQISTHHITSLTNNTSQVAKQSKYTLSATSNQQTTQHSSIVQSHQNISSQLAQANKKIRQNSINNNINHQQQNIQLEQQNNNNIYVSSQQQQQSQSSKRYNSIKSTGRDNAIRDNVYNQGVNNNHIVNSYSGGNNVGSTSYQQNDKQLRTRSKGNSGISQNIKPKRIGSGNPKTKNSILQQTQYQTTNQSIAFTNNPFFAGGSTTGSQIPPQQNANNLIQGSQGIIIASSKMIKNGGKKKNVLSGGTSYDFRSERCETVS